jgi:hypothetical protein
MNDFKELVDLSSLHVHAIVNALSKKGASTRISNFVDGFVWQIQMQSRALHAFKQASQNDKLLIMNAIARLANGHWPSSLKHVTLSKLRTKGRLLCFIVRIYKLAQSKYQIVWSVSFKESGEFWHSVLRIWGITRDDPLFVQQVHATFLHTSVPYLRKIAEVYLQESSQKIPLSFLKTLVPCEEESVEVVADEVPLLDFSKWYRISSSILHVMGNSEDLDPLLELSESERMLVRCTGPLFIMGRAGTGKTTVLLMRIYAELEDRLKKGVSFSGYPKLMACTMSPTLVIQFVQTFRRMKKLLAHEADISESCKDFLRNEGPAGCLSGSLLDFNEVSSYMSCIPNNLSLLRETHFPLFITFQKLILIIDGTLEQPFFGTVAPERPTWGDRFSSKISLSSEDDLQEVTLFEFKEVFWNHFDLRLVKKHSPEVVWREIISQIKVVDKNSLDRKYISRQEYMLESRKLSKGFESGEIYDLYEQYEKKRRVSGRYDIIDILHHIAVQLSRLRDMEFPWKSFDAIAIDEVQDFQPGCFSFLPSLLKDATAFSAVGDIAQAISSSGFRMERVKSLFYNVFGRSAACSTHVLSENFRTHSSIVAVSNSVLRFLHEYFPLEIDYMSPEKARRRGPIPVVFEAYRNEKETNEDVFLSFIGNAEQNIDFSFGADQCILVFDEKSKDDLLKKYGERLAGVLILSIFSAKGQEFDDVVMFNCLSDMNLGNATRLIYSFMHQKDMFESLSKSDRYKSFGFSNPKHFVTFLRSATQNFDPPRHSCLVTALKFFYVAITRTRNRLFIVESSKDVSPIFDYFFDQELVEGSESIEAVFSNLRENSKQTTEQDWIDRAREFLSRDDFDNAILSFKRAGRQDEADLCQARQLQNRGVQLWHINPTVAKTTLMDAASLYSKLEKYLEAAECLRLVNPERCATYLEMASCFVQAADVYFSHSKLVPRGIELLTSKQLWKHLLTKLSSLDSMETCKALPLVIPPLVKLTAKKSAYDALNCDRDVSKELRKIVCSILLKFQKNIMEMEARPVKLAESVGWNFCVDLALAQKADQFAAVSALKSGDASTYARLVFQDCLSLDADKVVEQVCLLGHKEMLENLEIKQLLKSLRINGLLESLWNNRLDSIVPIETKENDLESLLHQAVGLFRDKIKTNTLRNKMDASNSLICSFAVISSYLPVTTLSIDRGLHDFVITCFRNLYEMAQSLRESKESLNSLSNQILVLVCISAVHQDEKSPLENWNTFFSGRSLLDEFHERVWCAKEDLTAIQEAAVSKLEEHISRRFRVYFSDISTLVWGPPLVSICKLQSPLKKHQIVSYSYRSDRPPLSECRYLVITVLKSFDNRFLEGKACIDEFKFLCLDIFFPSGMTDPLELSDLVKLQQFGDDIKQFAQFTLERILPPIVLSSHLFAPHSYRANEVLQALWLWSFAPQEDPRFDFLIPKDFCFQSFQRDFDSALTMDQKLLREVKKIKEENISSTPEPSRKANNLTSQHDMKSAESDDKESLPENPYSDRISKCLKDLTHTESSEFAQYDQLVSERVSLWSTCQKNLLFCIYRMMLSDPEISPAQFLRLVSRMDFFRFVAFDPSIIIDLIRGIVISSIAHCEYALKRAPIKIRKDFVTRILDTTRHPRTPLNLSFDDLKEVFLAIIDFLTDCPAAFRRGRYRKTFLVDGRDNEIEDKNRQGLVLEFFDLAAFLYQFLPNTRELPYSGFSSFSLGLSGPKADFTCTDFSLLIQFFYLKKRHSFVSIGFNHDDLIPSFIRARSIPTKQQEIQIMSLLQ